MSDKPTLVILAAGMASRYGGNKQTESFGPSGETIMEYSIYDAIRAGFGKVVFIIRESFAEAFKASIEPKLAGKIETDYVYQEPTKFLGGRTIPPDRVKPFGTAHALLCTKGAVNGPFAVINADDFYGSDAFEKAYGFLTGAISDGHYANIGYRLSNTLSDNGSVTRGEIKVGDDGKINGIIERKEIIKEDGKAISTEGGSHEELPADTKVSMNFFCFTPAYIDFLEEEYGKFLDANMQNIKSEFLIPEISDVMIKAGKGDMVLISTDALWFGVTYKEDAPVVKAKLASLVNEGIYPNNLWS
ncbi:Nucleotidyl transferase [bacterium A37T11]|nr:Nucleotidyl transferase [bacterium A37T11]